MKVIFAACLLLVLTITSSECKHEKKQLPQICTDVGTPGNEVYNCFIAVSSSSQDACTPSCRDTLEEYADDCLVGGADAFKAALATLCGNNTNGGDCSDAATPGNELYDCFSAYALQSDDACTASCLEVLGEYAEECTGGSQAAADAYEEALERFCDENGGGDGDDGSGGDAATVAAALGSTITALVVAIAAVLN